MVSVCFYFQVHQPFRIRRYSIFDIGKSPNYFNHDRNLHELKKISQKCYLPTNNVLLSLLDRHPEFKISYSFSNVVLEQFEQFAPEVIDSFKELARTGRVEMLEETSHHSLSFLYDKDEFKEQVRLHRNKIRSLFSQTPTIFRNTELIYNNEIAHYLSTLGYKGVLAEGADHVLGWRSPNFVYSPPKGDIRLLLKNYRLSDDIAFRFSNRGWAEWPLTSEKFAQWVSAVNGNGNVVNLFMDYETFGEHQWEDTGIFEFLKVLPEKILLHPDNDFVTPSEAIDRYPSVGTLDIHNLLSWADIERDLSAWIGNPMQKAALEQIYNLGRRVKRIADPELTELWRKLQTSDHFYYMCTKWFSDGDVHKYFNPHDSPYEAYISYMNVLHDLRQKLDAHEKIGILAKR